MKKEKKEGLVSRAPGRAYLSTRETREHARSGYKRDIRLPHRCSPVVLLWAGPIDDRQTIV